MVAVAAGIPNRRITVFLADDNVLVREGVRALLDTEPDLEVVGVGRGLRRAGRRAPTPRSRRSSSPTSACRPTFQNEGIEAAKEVRKRHPGTGVVILSQYDDPEYAISLLSEGAAGYAYLLKDRVSRRQPAWPGRSARSPPAGRCSTPRSCRRSSRPVRDDGELTADQDELLRQVAEGRPVKAIAVSRRTTPEAVNDAIEALFLDLAHGASAGPRGRAAPAAPAADRRSSSARSRARR